MQTTIQLHHEREQERQEAYRLYEEKTDLGERLSLPIENYSYLERIDGHVYGRTVEGELRRMTEWSDAALQDALGDEGFSGANSVERTRRALEREEAYVVESLLPGQMLEVLSPIPDAVMAGATSLMGYRRDMARTLGRAYYREGETIHTVTYSLEKSNKSALAKVFEARGMVFPADGQSESILGSRQVTNASLEQFKQLAETVRFHYDTALYEQTGTVFYAGNLAAGKEDSMRFINLQSDLVQEHMQALADIMSLVTSAVEKASLAESLRQRTAAAIDARLHGIDVTSISDGSVGEQLAQGDYSGECATSPTSSQGELGLAQGKHITNCPLCGEKGVTATMAGETLSCGSCNGSVNVCSGDVKHGKPRKSKASVKTTPDVYDQTQRTANKKEIVRRMYGQHVSTKSELTFGGKNEIVYDVRTGEVIAKY